MKNSVRSLALAVVNLMLAASAVAGAAGDEPFRFRGYYITFMRMPTMDLPEWKEVIDCIQSDGGNTLLLWTAGAFRSKKFPITWRYNQDHKNVENNFVAKLIDYAHAKGVKVLLGFTPFAYDGVNQYPIEHPELKATQRNGNPAELWGIHSWGYNLCASKPEAQRFMLAYVREMFFEFYPNADGLLIESSDYAICFCPDCKERFFEQEFKFVETISQELWRVRTNATIVVYPHYFSGRKVPGFDVSAAKKTFDPRWTLFFTPHSAHVDPELLRMARTSIYSDDSPSLRTPQKIRASAQRARQHHITGYVPSLEGFSFRVEHPEGGEPHLLGTRLKPFGFEWLRDGQMPFNELLVRVNRIACREFSQNPDLTDAEFKSTLGRQVFGAGAKTQWVEDLLFLQEAWFADRSWWSASPLLTPDFLKTRATKENWTAERLSAYRSRLERIRMIEKQYRQASGGAEREMHRIAETIVKKWNEASDSILGKSLEGGK
jgi:hypothetical protein